MMHGVTRATVSILTCTTRRGVSGKASARKLGPAFLLMFRKDFGEVQILNTQGKGIKGVDEFAFFSESRVRSIAREMG